MIALSNASHSKTLWYETNISAWNKLLSHYINKCVYLVASTPHTLNIQNTHKMCKMPKESTLAFGKTVTVLLEHLAIYLLSFTYSNAKFACYKIAAQC